MLHIEYHRVITAHPIASERDVVDPSSASVEHRRVNLFSTFSICRSIWYYYYDDEDEDDCYKQMHQFSVLLTARAPPVHQSRRLLLARCCLALYRRTLIHSDLVSECFSDDILHQSLSDCQQCCPFRVVVIESLSCQFSVWWIPIHGIRCVFICIAFLCCCYCWFVFLVCWLLCCIVCIVLECCLIVAIGGYYLCFCCLLFVVCCFFVSFVSLFNKGLNMHCWALFVSQSNVSFASARHAPF